MAFYNQSPYEAKNRKSQIFGDRYEEVFNESIDADKVLLAHELYERIEVEKDKEKILLLENPDSYERKSYILYCSYHILHIIGELARHFSIQLVHDNLENIWNLYSQSIEIVEKIIQKERGIDPEKYSHSNFFRSKKSQKYFENFDRKELL